MSALLQHEVEEEAKVLRGRGVRSEFEFHFVAIGLWPGMSVLGRRAGEAGSAVVVGRVSARCV